uniref:RRM domain-containing protein n=1 Tax=Rhabditophanes sp. KR3021 TaxID=114890 RepID=A0AC35TKJ4_9BILA
MSQRVRLNSRNSRSSNSMSETTTEAPRERSPVAKRARDNSQADSNILYVLNVPRDSTWMELKDFMQEKCGGVKVVEYLIDRKGHSKNAAVVECESSGAATKLITALNRQDFKGRELVVNIVRDPTAFFRKVTEETGCEYKNGRIIPANRGAKRDHSSYTSSRNNNPNGGGSYNNSGGHVNLDTYGIPPAILRDLNIEPPLSSAIFVCNFDYKISAGKIFELFSLCGRITYIDVPYGPDHQPKGQAIVEFSHPSEAVNAIAMLNNAEYHGRKLLVKLDRKPRYPPSLTKLPNGLAGINLSIMSHVIRDPPLDQHQQLQQLNAPISQQTLIEALKSTLGSSLVGGPFVSPIGYDAPRSRDDPRSIRRSYDDEVGGYQQDSGYRGEFVGPGRPSRSGGPPQAQAIIPTQPFPPSGYAPSVRQQHASPRRSETYHKSATVIIRNFPVNYSRSYLLDILQRLGKIHNLEHDSTRGEATVEFSRSEEAEACFRALHNKNFEGRTVTVEVP